MPFLARALRHTAAAALVIAGWSAQASPLIAFEDFETVGPRDVSLPLLNSLSSTFTPASGSASAAVPCGFTRTGPRASIWWPPTSLQRAPAPRRAGCGWRDAVGHS